MNGAPADVHTTDDRRDPMARSAEVARPRTGAAVGIFGGRSAKPVPGTALDRAQAQTSARSGAVETGPVEGLNAKVSTFVERLLAIGIDGRGAFDSAQQVADAALASAGSREGAISAVTRSHVALAGAGGFLTGLGGFVTLPVALPINVLEFYILATRSVAAVAALRGYDLSRPEVRTAVLLTLAGADNEDILKKAGVVSSGRLAQLAGQRLPASVLMVINKGVGFRLITRAGQGALARFGRAVPVIGGGIGAGLDAFLLTRIIGVAKTEFPLQVTPAS
jgi:hypothetical protein